MFVPLPHYAKIKDRYCIVYYGQSEKTLNLLRITKPIIEQKLPGIQIYLSFLDETAKEEIPKSQLNELKNQFAHIREITDEDVTELLFDFL